MAETGVTTKIVFTGGAEVIVAAEAREVRRILGEDIVKHGEPFTHFTGAGKDEVDVYVAAGQVAFIQQALERTGFASF
jgi:hypothetical protein